MVVALPLPHRQVRCRGWEDSFVAPFVPTIVGTDAYVEELR